MVSLLIGLATIHLVACRVYQTVPDTPSSSSNVPSIPSEINNLSKPWLSNTHSLHVLPNWNQDLLLEVWPALLKNCQKINSQVIWQPFCKAIQTIPNNHDQARQILQQYLIATPIISHDTAPNRNIATAYFEPIYPASLYPIGPYQWPLYAEPVSAKHLSRKELTPSNGVVHPILYGKELAYLNNPIDAFLAHIQGSVQLKLQDDSMMRLGFAAKNNYPYQSIANTLIEQGIFKSHQASMERIKLWANTQSDDTVQAVLNTNPSFVFFKKISIPNQQGAIGALGISLTPMRSIAIDPKYTPLGSLVWLETDTLNGHLSQLMLAQDTGGAIQGPLRVDIYTGTGDVAGQLANAQKSPVKLWLLTPKL